MHGESWGILQFARLAGIAHSVIKHSAHKLGQARQAKDSTPFGQCHRGYPQFLIALQQIAHLFSPLLIYVNFRHGKFFPFFYGMKWCYV